MEVYQWLLRQNGFKVNPTGYFVYTNGRLDLDGFFDKVEFRTKVITYTGNDDWIEPTIYKIKEALESNDMPKTSADCQYCAYAEARVKLYELNRQKQLLKIYN